MVKKSKQVEKDEQLNLSNIEVGIVIQDHKGNDIEITEDIVDQMKAFEQSNPKSHAIWKNKVTGTFLYFKYFEDNPTEKNKPKKKAGRKPKAKAEEEPEEIEAEIETDELEEIEDEDETTKLDEAIEEEVVDEENLLLDAIDDYKAEFNVKKVNTNTKKFKAFFEEWKQVD